MAFWSTMLRCATTIREFLAPRYRPEQHYMRGPGPACARRFPAGGDVAQH
ncbi:MAG: hypothetical protein ABJG86_16530 [Nitratireductor sp.]|jgi:hypothetical protein